MKKVSAILLAMIVALSMSVTAFAATTGTITITNATVGQTYDLYKFFNAEYAPTPDADGNPIVSYTIEPSNKFYTTMFGADGKTANEFFEHDPDTHVVTKKSGKADLDVINYLDGLAAAVPPDQFITATGETVQFTGLATGYYLIDRGATSTVTITTNMPDIAIIDKNQLPGTNFDKLIVEDGGSKVTSNVSSVGGVIDFEIPFTATNYDGDEKVLYYTIHDEKDPGLWVEFEDVEVFVDGVKQEKGYYFFAGPVDDDADTGEWDYLGTWGAEMDPSKAQWYLIHYGYDEFEIVIPWVDDYTFSGNTGTNVYTLTFDLDEDDGNGKLSESMHDATADVVVTYSAAVGPDAAFEDTSENKATLGWEHTDGPAGNGDEQKTETKTHNLGISKVANDSAHSPLDGAIFELYEDADCTIPVNVIPVVDAYGNIVDGVYILDDVDIVITGMERVTSRDKYNSPALTEWLVADPDTDVAADARRNDMETDSNGKLVVLGLEDGTYYVKETVAPAGYNKLSTAVSVKVGEGSVTTVGSYSVYNTTIENSQGVELPSTGGEGTVKMITIGTVVAMAFAVLLITHKKMSVYHD